MSVKPKALIVLWLSALSGMACADDSQSESEVLHAIAYHDLRDEISRDADADAYALSTRNLIEHFHWLRENEFVPVSVEQILQARDGGATLPDKPVLLTFDDGFSSAYTHVFPLLKLFNYPAVVSVVTSWIDSDVKIVQGGETLTRKDFLSWDQIKAMHDSGLIEIASHSHDLHRGIHANPQGNMQPAAVTRVYANAGYENQASYALRIERDLVTSATLIEEHTGRLPRVVAWPYGETNAQATATARRLGMSLDLTLGDGRNETSSTATFGRHLIRGNPGVEALGNALLHDPAMPIVRVAQVDLDYVYDPDAAQQEENLGVLLDRVKALELPDTHK